MAADREPLEQRRPGGKLDPFSLAFEKRFSSAPLLLQDAESFYKLELLSRRVDVAQIVWQAPRVSMARH